MKIVTIEQMRRIEHDCAGFGVSTDMLMENAGKAVAEEVKSILGAVRQKRILVLIGPGNNGGDGLVTARYLHDWGAEVSIYLCSARTPEDANLKLVQERGIDCVDGTQDKNLGRLNEMLSSADAVIDSLFGTGKTRELRGIFPQVLNKVSERKKQHPAMRIIAVDLPSGLNADSGAADPACVFADNTITLGFPKPGLFGFPGAERVGKISIADIGIPPQLAADVQTELVTGDWARSALPERPLHANKGSFGRVLVAASSINYIGAASLACNGAMRVGAGLVTLATASSLQPILASKLTEITYLPLPESQSGIISAKAAELVLRQAGNYNVLLLGCGLGQSRSVTDFIRYVLFQPEPKFTSVVIDADGLNTLAKIPEWWQELNNDAILTPHPGEMARLCGVSTEEVQSDRLGIARKMAQEWNKTVVLKGAYTTVAAPNGRCCLSPVVNPGLASAGTGDVLSGAIAGLAAQGLPLFDAAALGVYLHGKAGEMVRSDMGDAGMIATDLLPALPRAIKELKESDAISS